MVRFSADWWKYGWFVLDGATNHPAIINVIDKQKIPVFKSEEGCEKFIVLLLSEDLTHVSFVLRYKKFIDGYVVDFNLYDWNLVASSRSAS